MAKESQAAEAASASVVPGACHPDQVACPTGVTDIKRKGRGGARPGAGRRAIDGVRNTTSHTIRLDDATRDYFMSLGNNELSAGIRIAARRLMGGGNATPNGQTPVLQLIKTA